MTRSRLAKLIAAGGVARGGAVLSEARARVAEGDEIEIAFAEPTEVATSAQAIPLNVVHEDDELIVIDKPAGMVVHPAPGSPSGTLVNALLAHCGDSLSGIGGEKRPGIVHRIDKETSGLLVIAKTDKAHAALSAQFAAHSVERHYNALVFGVPDPGDPRLRGLDAISFEPGGVMRIATRIGRHPSDRQRQAVLNSGGRHAVTRVRVVETFGAPPTAALVECWLETGRTHQIRVHLAHAGHGLIGDPVYGGRRRLSERAVGTDASAAAAEFPRQALHAATLGFVHPGTGEKMRFESALPEDMALLAAALRF
ncbi:ribosomal large subunit pseudouridine synthase D [Rhodovulum steppense]|uniref:Pseudouridine synthase n=1 Tax=Rhodovulum steppense TaxID=540251 RepID=A0A4R1YVK4_9RHOB|nr:ribosomal large subunit pseudouridine synthase D [Rhodovulum steppense]